MRDGHVHHHWHHPWVALGTGILMVAGEPGAIAQTSPAPAHPALQITVNSAADGPITPDSELTLREALELANGTLPLAALSTVEQGLVQPGKTHSQIGFDIVGPDTTIDLTAPLPTIMVPGLTLDGTTQAGYGDRDGVYPGIPVPVIHLTPAAGAEVFRGLAIAASGVTVRGLALYGFNGPPNATLSTPATDILISNAPPPQRTNPIPPLLSPFLNDVAEEAVRDTVLEANWLGITPAETIPSQRSAFGVVVFNAINTAIQGNRIQHHEGSAVITGVRAEGLQLTDNVIVGNGVAGMPDAVRLEGQVSGANLQTNLICGNDGSGIYLFKPEGSVTIQGNDIRFNGRRLERAAVYLMGDDHQVLDNLIGYQPGPGVAIAAHPLSQRNLIRQNEFTALDGLSIDLVTQGNSGSITYQQGDGPNPPRNSANRRLDTANGAVNAPAFPAYTLERQNGLVTVTGQADPGTEVDLYQVTEAGIMPPLGMPLATVTADASGTFTWVWENPEGAWIGAIATDPAYGTSEPSPAIGLMGLDGTLPERGAAPYLATCEPPPPPEPVPPPVVPEPEPEPIQLRIPRNIHFALDRSDLSAESTAVLDQIAAAMLAYPVLVVELQGHTDPRASVAYNQALSERRATAARDYLLRKGVSPERMRIRPLGESQRATSGNTRLDYARDRRVEFIFLDTRGLDIIFENQEVDLQVE